MTYAMLKCTLAAAVFAVVAVEANGAQPPVGSPRAVSPIAPLDSHVARHPKTKTATATARVKPASAAARPGVAAVVPGTTPVPSLERRPKPAPRQAPPGT